MTGKKHMLISCLMALGALAATGGHAEEKAAVESSAPASSEQQIAESLKKLVFTPHDTGAPEVTDAGGVRSVTMLPKIELLAPERLARTLSPTPTLYWHISKATQAPLRFTLLNSDALTIDPLLEIALGDVEAEGIYGISLDDHGITLEPNKRYVWSIALSPKSDSHSGDIVAQTVMEHSPAPALTKALDAARPEDRAVRLAAEGFWYDAIDVLSAQIEAEAAIQVEATSPWQVARARLLDRAGLLHAARFDQALRGPR